MNCPVEIFLGRPMSKYFLSQLHVHKPGKHNITPLKDLAPKRRKLNIPLTLENMLSPFQDVEEEVLIDLEQIESGFCLVEPQI
jgi:hypothetical protein